MCTCLCAIVAVALVGLGLFHEQAADVARPGAPAEDAPGVRFIGNAAVSSSELRAAIAADTLFDGAGRVVPEVLERGVLLIQMLYWDRGHVQVRVAEPKVSPSQDAVTITIQEGPVFRIGTVVFTGDLIGSAKANLRMIQVRPGILFSRTMIGDDLQTLNGYYQDQGYAFANILPLTKVDLASRTVGLTFEIKRGKRASFERIEIHGNSKTSARAIRRAMKIAEGELYTNSGLEEGKQRLEALGFDEVAISIKRGSTDELVVVTIEVRE